VRLSLAVASLLLVVVPAAATGAPEIDAADAPGASGAGPPAPPGSRDAPGASGDGLPAPPGSRDAPDGPRRSRLAAEDRAFLVVADPATPARLDVTLEYGLGLSSSGGATRPLPAVLGERGLAHSLTLAVGATARLAPFVSVQLAADPAGGAPLAAGCAGVRWQVTAPGRPFRLGVAVALLREAGGDLGAWARLAATYDLGRLRVATNLHLERSFAAGRDAVDVVALAGLSVRLTAWLRLGLEYVGQDLEAAVERDEAEGGAQHYAGPTLALALDRGRVQLAAGPMLGLNPRAARAGGRAALLVTF
jgi:hypothetical protein